MHDYGHFEMRLFICVYVGLFISVVVRVYPFPLTVGASVRRKHTCYGLIEAG